MQVHILESFNNSYDLAYQAYGADWDVKPAIVSLRRYILDAANWCNNNNPLDDMSDDTVEAARQSYSSFLNALFERDPGALDRETASFLRGICKSIALAEFPSTSDLDHDSRIYVWHPPSRKYRKFTRSVGVYLHHPINARDLLHVWIGADHDLEDCINQFRRTDFNWSNLSSDYGAWLIKQSQKRDGH